jgi:hypothetical protein
MNDTATQQGAARQESPDVNAANEVEIHPNPRNAQLEAMADRQEAARIAEISEAEAGDPGFAANQQRINQAIVDANAEVGIVHESEAPAFGPNDGAASRERMHPEIVPTVPALPAAVAGDPMAEFIEMHDGAPMVKVKVNGQDRLLPFADAKRQLQIGVAAEVRMQGAAQREATVDARERKLSAGEAALQARMNVQAQTPPVPAQPDLSENDLLEEAQDIFNTAFSGTEEDAAKKLAKTLAKIQRSATPVAQPRIDSGAIARQAASLVQGTLTAEAKKKDVRAGYAQFKTDYPDIVGESYLFKMADDMTGSIEREHPDWAISQVMDEAGQRTRNWVKNLNGETDNGQPPPPAAPNHNAPLVTQSTQTRQDRKAALVRMPTPAAGAQFHEPEVVTEGEQSPQEAFADLKASRGQPT